MRNVKVVYILIITLFFLFIFGDIFNIKKRILSVYFNIKNFLGKKQEKEDLNPWPSVLETTILTSWTIFLVMMRSYFLEIQNRLILVFILQISTLFSLYCYKTCVLFTVISPIIQSGESMHFIFTGVTEPFSVYLSLTFFINNQLSVAYFIYHSFIFLLPAFYKLEFRNMFLLSKVIFVFWVLSAFAANLVLIPWTWLFFLEFYSSSYDLIFNTYFESKLLEYVNFYISFYWVNFLYFQFIGVLFFLLNLPKTTLKFIQKYRKIFLFLFFLISALVCPDVFSQLIFVLFLISTYELSLFGKLLNFR